MNIRELMHSDRWLIWPWNLSLDWSWLFVIWWPIVDSWQIPQKDHWLLHLHFKKLHLPKLDRPNKENIDWKDCTCRFSLYLWTYIYIYLKLQSLYKLNVQNILPLSTRKKDKYFFYLNYGQWWMADLTHEFRIWIDLEFWSETLDRSPQKEHWLFQILH